MAAMIIVGVILAVLVVLSFTTDVLGTFAPVVNSGSAVIAVAFVAGVFIYRWMKKRNRKE